MEWNPNADQFFPSFLSLSLLPVVPPLSLPPLSSASSSLPVSRTPTHPPPVPQRLSRTPSRPPSPPYPTPTASSPPTSGRRRSSSEARSKSSPTPSGTASGTPTNSLCLGRRTQRTKEEREDAFGWKRMGFVLEGRLCGSLFYFTPLVAWASGNGIDLRLPLNLCIQGMA